MPALLRLLAVLLVALAAAPAAALASSSTQTGIADDGILLKEPSDTKLAAIVADWAALGIDDVRILAQWQTIAPTPGARRAPSGFDGADPDSPGYDWSRVDRAVRFVREAGMRPMLVLTGPGPLWASQAPDRRNVRYKPRPDLFGAFARAAARHFAADVDRYIIWNEPNLPLWLQPQNTCSGSRCTPYAPHLYRRLVRAAYPAIRAADPSASVLFGALAPRGEGQTKTNARTRPLAFIRDVGCVDKRLRRVRRGPCAGFAPLTADGFAYHPHSVLRAPDDPQPNPDDASIADITRLERTLDATQRAGGLKRHGGGRFGLYFTEYGYQTRPPDPIQGVTLAQQSRWLQQGAYIAWHDPRVKLLTQYEWRDEKVGPASTGLSRYSGWQSGLNFSDGRAKPALRSFANPFFIAQRPGSRAVRLWGQVRPGTSHRVRVERRATGTTRWVSVRAVQTNATGYWTLNQTVSATVQYRFRWQPDGASSSLRTSDVLRVRPPARRG